MLRLRLMLVAWLALGGAPGFAPAQTPAADARAPSFVNDVLPLLTRLGCNQGACHGKSAGQNGFRLSLRGYAPEWDHAWLTREYAGRRVNLTDPSASLVLQKPLGLVPHEGGKLFARGSREHQVLLDWIAAGAPGPLKDEVKIRKLELLPGNRIVRTGEALQLEARAEYSDGTHKDATWLAQFASGDSSVAEVSPKGLVKILRPGETPIRAAFQGHVAVVVLTNPHPEAVNAERFAPKNNFIDEHVFKKLADLHIEPSDGCSDETFLRRAYLDTIGVLPTPVEVRAFLSDENPRKRAKLIDDLLERPEFVDFWAQELGDLLQNRRESDHDVRGTKGVRSFHEWLRKRVAANQPWDKMARDILTASGSVTDSPAVGYFILTVGENREAHRSSVVAAVAQTFLGVRIGCAQCHNHPLEKYTQDDYYRFAGYFSRIKLERKDPKTGPTLLLVGHPDKNQDKNPVGVVQPRTGMFLAPQTLERTPAKIEPGDDPRLALAEWLTDPANEYFAGAMVNRLWAHFMGVGLVEPIDDLRASNPPTNPDLWNALVKEFVKAKFDRKHMMRFILGSRAYQLSSTTRAGNDKDTRFYSHFYARRLPAEVMLDAIAQATGEPERFDGYPIGIRAMQVPDPAVKSHFLGLFGRSERLTACACERNGEVTLPQLLHLAGGSTIEQKIRAEGGRLAGLLKSKKSDDEIIDELFLATLCRLPQDEHRRQMHQYLREAGGSREEVFRDVFWVIMNTKEFAFNH